MRSPTARVGAAVLALAAAVATVLVVLQFADDSPEESEPALIAILTSPRSIVFRQAGETASLGFVGIYSDRSEQALPDQSGLVPVFSSSDPAVATVDSSGQVTAVAPGGIDILVDYGSMRTAATVIVYGPFVNVPPFDVQLVAEIAPGVNIVVNRVIVAPANIEYDSALAHAIASDHNASVIAEWRNLGAFLLQFNIVTLTELDDTLQELEDDTRIARTELNFLYELASQPSDSYDFHRLTEISDLLTGVKGFHDVQIAVIDVDLTLMHDDDDITDAIKAEIDEDRVVLNDALDAISKFSHGLAMASIIAGQNEVPGAVKAITSLPYTLHLYNAGANGHFDYDLLDDALKDLLDKALVLSASDHMTPHQDRISVVNMSFTLQIPPGSRALQRFDILTNVLETSVDTVFVLGAGNSGIDASEEFPARMANTLDNVIAVGSVQHNRGAGINRSCWNDARQEASNYGSTITVAAEGTFYALDTSDPRGYGMVSGTSGSAALVSGIVALMRAVDPSLSPAQVREILTETAKEVTVDEVPRDGCGNAPQAQWKVVDAPVAMCAVLTRTDCPALRPTMAATPTPRATATSTPTPRPASIPTPAPRPTATPTSTWSPTPTLAVSAGLDHTCGVEADGSVTCWGDDREGQASPPSGEFRSVSAGSEHTCGIRTDRSVVCWGNDEEDQASPPAGEFMSVSAGWKHSCGVRANGSVECWGEDGPFKRTQSPEGAFTSVSAAQYHTCGVMQDGSIACWGYGQGGRTTPPLDRFTSVSVGGDHSCGIRTDGSVACWGNIDEGQATPPPGTFVSVSVSKEGHRTCGVRTDGSAICWGAGIHLGIVSPEIRMPVSIQPDGRFSSISAGAQHVCGIRPGGEVVCWGSNDRGPAVTPGVPFVSVSPGDRHECGLRADGSVACYGYDVFEQTNVPPGLFTSLSVGHSHNCAIKKADGSLTCWGWNWDGQATAPAGTFVEVGLAWTHSCGLRESGEIECWGEIDRTPLGGPFKAFATSANGDGCGLRQDDSGSVECWGEHVSGENGPPDEAFTSVAVGWGHACGIRADGTVACWGSLNASGEASPPDGQFTAISLGNSHSCGMREGGEIECWGANYFGQAEAPDGTFTAISTHTNRTCAVRTDGSYACWGE